MTLSKPIKANSDVRKKDTKTAATATATATMPMKALLSLSLFFILTPQRTIFTSSYCVGYLRNKDIAGIWRLTSKQSFLPKVQSTNQQRKYPMKEFTVYPKKKSNVDDTTAAALSDIEQDILLLLKEDGKFVQYAKSSPIQEEQQTSSSSSLSSETNHFSTTAQSTYAVNEMKGSWALVDGKLILAADRRKDITNIRAGGHDHDTILEGRIVAVSDQSLLDNPAIIKEESKTDDEVPTQMEGKEKGVDNVNSKGSGNSRSNSRGTDSGTPNTTEDVHLSVPKGKVKIGKFFYPQNHPSFFETPMFHPTATGSFELRQVLGHLNTQIQREDEKLVEKFKKKDLMDKRYFITSYPLPVVRKRKKRWSIKYNKFVDAKPKSAEEKEWEERQKNAPIPIKTFEVDLFANNTFQTATGLGDTILRGKWSIVGEKRDQLWMKVWRFGFGRAVSGSTFSEGASLSHKDDVAYWGKIYEVDTESKDDNNPGDDEKTTKIEINGSVMFGVGLEPCSIARFTMIEKSEDDFYEDEDEDEDDLEDIDGDDDGDFYDQFDDMGMFE